MISRRGMFIDPERPASWDSRGPVRGASFIGAWADEAVTWKTGRSIESYMDEVIREVMGCDER